MDALVRRQQPRLLATARGIVQDDAAAEDVVQEVWCRLWSFGVGEICPAALASWLRLATVRCALDWHRRSRRAKCAPDFDWVHHPDTDADPVSAAVAGELLTALSSALHALPNAYREAFHARFGGLTYTEAAEVSGCGAKTLSTRLFRARSRLRSALRHYHKSA